jgi:RNA polymerase sigma factor (sigma-70 family)
MEEARASGDLALVRACLSGSEQAWDELYCRYVALVKSMVRRHFQRPAPWEVDDIIQSVFAALVPALRSYNAAYSLSRFVCVIAERVCIQEYRQSKAAKRAGQTEPVDHHDGDEGGKSLRSEDPSQEDLLSRYQAQEVLNRALKRLDSSCRELLKLRYIEELPYKKISEILEASENTLTVRARRCLRELSAAYSRELIRPSEDA